MIKGLLEASSELPDPRREHPNRLHITARTSLSWQGVVIRLGFGLELGAHVRLGSQGEVIRPEFGLEVGGLFR